MKKKAKTPTKKNQSVTRQSKIRSATELHSMATNLLAKIVADIENEKSFHRKNGGARKALGRIGREVLDALKKFNKVEPEAQN
jgi:hypothetical protein